MDQERSICGRRNFLELATILLDTIFSICVALFSSSLVIKGWGNVETDEFAYMLLTLLPLTCVTICYILICPTLRKLWTPTFEGQSDKDIPTAVRKWKILSVLQILHLMVTVICFYICLYKKFMKIQSDPLLYVDIAFVAEAFLVILVCRVAFFVIISQLVAERKEQLGTKSMKVVSQVTV